MEDEWTKGDNNSLFQIPVQLRMKPRVMYSINSISLSFTIKEKNGFSTEKKMH